METTLKRHYKAHVAGMPVSYYLTGCEVATDTGVHKRYGVAVECSDGQRAEYPDIFADSGGAADFLATLCRCGVTPVTLGDIVYDYLCREDVRA